MKFDKKLFDLTKGIRAKFIFVVLAGLIGSIFTIQQALLLSKVISRVFLQHQILADVSVLIFIFIAISLLKVFILWLQNYFSAGIVLFIKKTLRKKILNKIEEAGPTFLKSERTGEIVSTLLTGVDKLEDYFSKYLPQIFLSVFIPVIILIFVFTIDLLTGIIFLITAPIIPIFMYLIGSIAEKMNKKQWESLSRMSSYFFDVLQGLTTLKLFNKTKDIIKRIDSITNIFRIKTMNVLKIAFLSSLVLELAATISVAIIAVEIGLRLLAGNFNYTEALFILILAPEFYMPFRLLGASYHAGMEGTSAFERIDEILQTKTYIFKQTNDKIERKDFTNNSAIIFDNVAFRYPQREIDVLENISFTIEPKKVTALVGESGAGKSTILNLILRFIEPSRGNITASNFKLNEIDKNIWRENLSWLPQNPYLFKTSIEENIKLSKPDAALSEVIEAAKITRIHNLISSLPNGYNTGVNESAANFSGGEVQRIALARAYLRNSPFLLIDEPTANLDPIVEEEIIKDMYNLFADRTVLIIAHRLSTISKADKIIVIRNGKIDNIGTHNELMLKSDYYKNLFETYEVKR
jgi:ATP-binding cassette subfamily C protein CydD